MSIVDAISKARAEGQPQALVEHIPYARALGMSMSIKEGQLVGQMDFAQHLIGDIGVGALHGGTIGSLLESTAIFTLLWEVEKTQMPKTINLTVEYLRSGRPKRTYARAEIARHGRRIANVRATAWQEDVDKPIAAVYAHFLLVPQAS
ncbi:MAG: PaaI family thioesterase [Myxococcales bacterium]|nr:PaaI family thioesterase [Myxococcales bacterium]